MWIFAAEGLVEGAAQPEEDDGIRIFLLDALVLVEDWDRLQGVA